MKAPNSRVSIPVIKRVRRSDWHIPRPDEKIRREKYVREEAALEQLGRGTGPQERFLLHALTYNIGKNLENGVRGDIILAETEREVRQFAMLREQWSLLLSRRLKISFQNLIDAGPTLFSVMVIGIVKEFRAKRTKPFDGFFL